jgi:DNA-binding NarL/FixJ family response regulator
MRDGVQANLLGRKLVDAVEHARSLAEANEILKRDCDFAIVVLDLNLSDAQGLTVLEALRDYRTLPKLVYTAETSPSMMEQAYRLGAFGYVTKDEEPRVLREAIATVIKGQIFFSAVMREKNGWAMLPVGEAKPESEPGQDELDRYFGKLTARQWQVALMAAADGMPNKVIGAKLDIAEGTVKVHLNAAYRIFGVRSCKQLTIRFSELGIKADRIPDQFLNAHQ